MSLPARSPSMHARSARVVLTSLFTVSALALATVTFAPRAQAAEAPRPALTAAVKVMEAEVVAEVPSVVGLEIDAKALGAEGGPLANKLRGDIEAQCDAAGFALSTDKDDPVIIIVIERAADPEKPGYMVGLSMEKGDEIISGSARQSDCSLCTRTELVAQIAEEVDGLLEIAAEHQPLAPVPDDDGGSGGAEGAGEDAGGEDEGGGGDGKKLGTLGIAGIGVGVVGLIGVGVGVGLVVVGEQPVEPMLVEQRNFKPGGFAALAVGGVALVTGIVMIALDASKRKKANSGTARVQWRGNGFAF